MISPETELLEALSAAIAHPDDPSVATRLLAAHRPLAGHALSDEARAQVRTLAGLRERLHRDFLFFLFGALRGDADPSAIAFMIALVPDAGLGHNATDALEALDPLVVAGPYRAANIGPSLGSSANQSLRSALEAKLDLAQGRPVEITTDLLELWVTRCDLATTRLAIAAGADVNVTIANGESLLHALAANWIVTTSDDPIHGPTRTMWESMIAMLIAAGADVDRKLEMRFRTPDLSWPKGASPRKMIADQRKSGGAPVNDLDRLEALFPAKKSGKKSP